MNGGYIVVGAALFAGVTAGGLGIYHKFKVEPYQRALCAAAQEIPTAKAYFENKGVLFETHYNEKDGKPYYILVKGPTSKSFPALDAR